MESRLRLPLAAVFFFVVAMLVLVATPQVGSGASGITYTFDGAPASPKPFNPADWDVAVSSRDQSTFLQPQSMNALHGGDCGAPPATHVVNTYEGTVFQCKDHLMTSILAEGYGVIYLTPNQLVDFSQGEAVIKWDVSTFRTSARDFLDFWITPFEENLQLPMDEWLPDGQGEPKDAIHIRMDGQPGATIMRGAVIRNFQVQELNSNWWTYYENVLTPDQKLRTTFEVRISKTHLKVGIPQYNLWWVDASFADLGWSRGVFQMGHHSYHPWKDGGGPNTWHFDNVSISPATPFTMLKGDKRYVEMQNQVVTFNGPAPAGSKLRFSAVGTIDVSFDNGATFQRAQRQQEEGRHPDHFSSYWTPIPAGTASVMFRGGFDTWFEDWFAKDFAIWSLSTTSVSPPPTSTAVSTNTAVPPTATRTSEPSSPTATPTKTATPVISTVSKPGTRIQWQGKEWYLHGVNLPWYNWSCDFGCNGNGGASSAAVRSAVGDRLAQLKVAGIHNLRWWLFPGDPWQITRDASGAPSAINPAVYADIDAAIAMANANDLYLTFTLFSAPSALPSTWLTDPIQRDRLATVLGTLFAHYRGNSRILAWEVVNEPEWDIWNGKVAQSDVQALVGGVAAQVHSKGGGSLVTVGGAMLDGLPMWVGLGLDFHSPHWYDYMSSGDWCARCTDYDGIKAKYHLDAPVVVGEVYAGTDSDAAARYRDFYAKGYAGAWSWSLFPERTADKLGIDMTAAAAFAASKADDGPTSATVAPLPATATATPVFTATPTQTATPVKTATPTQTATPKPSATVPAATPTPTDGGKVLPVTWITSATTSPAMGVRRGSLATITTNVTATGSATALVDMEIYDLNGNKVYQKSWDNRTFTSNLRRRYAATWVVPANLPMGTYIVKVGIFSPGWGTLYHWNENAGVLQVK